MSNKIQEIIKNRLNEMSARQAALVENWKPFISKVDSYLQSNQNKSLNDWDKKNIAQCLENATMDTALAGQGVLNEATSASNIDFLGVQLPVIAALLPSLALNDVAMVQALDRRQGAIFYMDVKHGTTKGDITAGDSMISATTGRATSAASRTYAMNRIEDEVLSDDTLSTATLSGDFDYTSIRLGSVVITDGTETFTDSVTPGQLVSGTTGNVAGWVTRAGTFQVTFASAPASAGVVTADYFYDYDTADSGSPLVPEVNFDMRSDTVTAIDFTLRSKYSLSAALDLQKAHGLSLENEVIKILGGDIKFQIDHYGLDQILQAATGTGAATANGTWDGTPADGQEWIWKKNEFYNTIEKASNNIFDKTLRAMCNFLICGNDVARVIKQLPTFVPAPSLGKQAPTGPMKIGTLDGKTIVQDPFQTSTRYVAGYRGNSYLETGFIYAPYIPLFTTPTIMLSNLESQKGFMSSCGFKTTNPGMYCYGDISLTI